MAHFEPWRDPPGQRQRIRIEAHRIRKPDPHVLVEKVAEHVARIAQGHDYLR